MSGKFTDFRISILCHHIVFTEFSFEFHEFRIKNHLNMCIPCWETIQQRCKPKKQHNISECQSYLQTAVKVKCGPLFHSTHRHMTLVTWRARISNRKESKISTHMACPNSALSLGRPYELKLFRACHLRKSPLTSNIGGTGWRETRVARVDIGSQIHAETTCNLRCL